MLTRLDDGLIDHDKVEEAAERLGKQGYLIALGAVSWAICYANKKLTDGMVPDRALNKYGVPQSTADVLVAVKLWERVEDGYRIHDFHDWNPTASEVKSKRSRDRDRKRKAYGFRAEKLVEREVESSGTANTGRDSLSLGSVSEGEPEREPKPTQPKQPPEVPIGQLQLVVNELVADYNARADRVGLPIVTNAEPSRNRLLNAVRLRPSMDEWRDVLDRAFRSDFLLGRVPGPDGSLFRAFNLWWLIDKDHADKALAGAYENRSVVAKSAPQPVLGPRTKGLAETAAKYLNSGSKAS